MPRDHNGCILYRGPSQLDDSPIVAILTGLQRGSKNTKTGAMLQTWILSATQSPLAAVASGNDAGICGPCPHRGNGQGQQRSCYVTLAHGPAAVYRAFLRDAYPPMSLLDEQSMEGRPIRLGAYGDPVAVPFQVWASVLRRASSWTGYTHQWRTCPDVYKRVLMASVDSLDEYHQAKAAGWRTFRIRQASGPVLSTECVCPASAEGGHRTTCDACVLCQGAVRLARDVCIIAHGTGHKYIPLERIV